MPPNHDVGMPVRLELPANTIFAADADDVIGEHCRMRRLPETLVHSKGIPEAFAMLLYGIKVECKNV